MVRDETEEKLREMARVDAEITGLLFPRGAAVQKAEMYTDPLTKVGSPALHEGSGSDRAGRSEGARKQLIRQMSDSISVAGKSGETLDDGLR